MKHLDLNTIKLPVIIREPISLKSIIRKFMVTCNFADNSYWFDKSLVKDSGKFNLTLRFKNN
jgi:hypothetical protein